MSEPREPAETSRKRGGRPSRRTSRCTAEVPGIVGGPVEGVIVLPIRQRERHIGFAKQHRADGLEACHRDRVLREAEILEDRHPPGRRQSGHVQRLFDRRRNAKQWAALAPLERCVSRTGGIKCATEIPHANRINARILSFDAGNRQLRQLKCRYASRRQRGHELGSSLEIPIRLAHGDLLFSFDRARADPRSMKLWSRARTSSASLRPPPLPFAHDCAAAGSTQHGRNHGASSRWQR
jgi:hypothetical protein